MKGRFQCDACGYLAPERVELTEALIDTPCPKCGANMLTREQYDLSIATSEAIRAFFKSLGIEVNDEPAPGSKAIRINPVRGTVTMEDGS